MKPTTKTARRLEEIRLLIKRFEGKAVDEYTFENIMKGQTINQLESNMRYIISFKNELKEIIKLPLIKEHIELLIQEIESVETASRTSNIVGSVENA
ncbi:MAG: hypothetical protein AABY22_25075 [Nanoarchaeota archaeon]